jgi:hypothetical protein
MYNKSTLEFIDNCKYQKLSIIRLTLKSLTDYINHTAIHNILFSYICLNSRFFISKSYIYR